MAVSRFGAAIGATQEIELSWSRVAPAKTVGNRLEYF